MAFGTRPSGQKGKLGESLKNQCLLCQFQLLPEGEALQPQGLPPGPGPSEEQTDSSPDFWSSLPPGYQQL